MPARENALRQSAITRENAGSATIHAEERLDERRLTRGEVEQAVREGHSRRELNYGDADWRIHAGRSDGHAYAITYDNPAHGDSTMARIVTAWPLRTVSNP